MFIEIRRLLKDKDNTEKLDCKKMENILTEILLIIRSSEYKCSDCEKYILDELELIYDKDQCIDPIQNTQKILDALSNRLSNTYIDKKGNISEGENNQFKKEEEKNSILPLVLPPITNSIVDTKKIKKENISNSDLIENVKNT